MWNALYCSNFKARGSGHAIMYTYTFLGKLQILIWYNVDIVVNR